MGLRAAPNWPIEKPPASGYLVLPSNGQSIISTDIMYKFTHPCRTKKTLTEPQKKIEINNHICLSVCFNVIHSSMDRGVLADSLQ